MEEGDKLGPNATYSRVLSQEEGAEESTTGHQVEGEGRHQQQGSPPGILAEQPLEEWSKGKGGEAHTSQCQTSGQGSPAREVTGQAGQGWSEGQGPARAC